MPAASATSAIASGDSADLDEPQSEQAKGNTSEGMGRRVAGGGAWTALGEVARFITAMLATKAIAHQMDPTSFGVWSILTRIISSLSFADAGVGTVSTTYVAQAYARGDRDGERRALWTSLLVALVPSILVALVVLLGAHWAVRTFFHSEVPDNLRVPMAIGLQVGAFGFVLRTLTAVFNSPLLARLQLKLNTLIFYGSIVLQLGLAPAAIRWGGIAWGASVSAILWGVTGVAYMAVTARLIPGSMRPSIDRTLLPPMARFGAGALVVALAGQVLYSADLLIVGSFSTSDAAYYQIAFSAANALSILPAALASPLQPAFSRLLARDEQQELQVLVRRAMRALCLSLPPIITLMCAVARPFFLWQGGPDYLLHSTPLFLCFLGGMVLSVVVTIPSTLLMAMRRTDLTARIGLFEVVPFMLYTWAMTSAYGAIGAAVGRSLRFAILCAIVFPLTARLSKVRFSPRLNAAPFALALACAALPIVLLLWSSAPQWTQFPAAILGVTLYMCIVFASVLDREEKALSVKALARVTKKLKR